MYACVHVLVRGREGAVRRVASDLLPTYFRLYSLADWLLTAFDSTHRLYAPTDWLLTATFCYRLATDWPLTAYRLATRLLLTGF